jgi:riboflavin kinase / FMN adenylyltransferase
MKLIRGWHNLKKQLAGSVVTIGNFDGVHLGHQRLLADMNVLSKKYQLPSVLIIFEPHPMEFFLKDKAPARLMKLREKLIALSSFEIDYVLCLKFNAALAGLSPEAFVIELLVKKLQARSVVVGDDFRFGKKRQGDVTLLKKLGAHYNFSVDQLPTKLQSDERISSTSVRKALAADDLEKAKALLGRPYTLVGKVVHGDKIGRTLGFPTANLYVHRAVVALKGVFVVKARINDQGDWIYGVANLGTRPVVAGQRVLLEVFLFDFDSNIYAHNLEVAFLHKIRDEVMLDSLDDLKKMIEHDVVRAMAWLSHPE